MTVNKIINERLKLLKNSNRTFKDIFEIIHHNSEFLFAEKTDGFRISKVTYGECYNYSYKMGSYLSGKLSDSKYVGLMMENSLEFITSMYGILMNNKIPVLLNIRLGSILNNQVINRLGIKEIICDKEYDVNALKIVVNNIDYDTIINIDSNMFIWENKLALTTSATSLNIKICFYDGEAICTQIENSKDICKTNPMIKKHYNGYIKQLAFLPFYHIFGLMASYFWFSFFGRSFVFLKDLSSDTLLKTIKKHQVTHIFAVPMLWHTVYKNIIKEVEKEDPKTIKKFYKGLKLSTFVQRINPKFGIWFASKIFKRVRTKLFNDSVKFMISGGSYLSYDVSYTINALGYPLFNGYGMSEIGITSVELSKNIKVRNKRSIGKPLKTVEYKINENNQLLVKSRGICTKIVTMNNEFDTDYDAYFNTQDIVFDDKTGRYFIEGRTDDIVLTDNGEKINPDVIEQTLSIPSVERYALLGIENNNKIELSLVLELKYPLTEIKINQINRDVDNMLKKLSDNKYVINKIYYTFDPIASPTAIKVSRKILIKWIKENKVNLLPFNELQNMKIESLDELSEKVSIEILMIFKDVLNISKEIGLGDHFIFDLGGTSLDYLTLLMKIEEKYEFKFHQSDEICYTVLQFTKYIINLLNKE